MTLKNLTKLDVLSAAALTFAAAGEFSAPVGWTCMFVNPLALVLAMWSIAAAVAAARRRDFARAARAALTLLLAVIAVEWTMRITFGVPTWARWRAEPIIAELARWQGEHGAYPVGSSVERGLPETIRAMAEQTGCIYSSDDARSFHLICQGVLFTSCSYDSSTEAWYGWD